MTSNMGNQLPLLILPSTPNLSPPSPLSAASTTPGARPEKPLPPMPRAPVELNVRVGGSSGFIERGSWIDISDNEEPDFNYLRAHPSAALPPSPYSPSSMQSRPRAPTPSAAKDDLWSPRPDPHLQPISPSSSFAADSPTSFISAASSPLSAQPYQSPLLRSVSEGETPLLTESLSTRSFARPPKATLPDPSQFPDPYPFRPPHHHLTSTPPALSSAGSSSASTRSSAYTSSSSALASGDYGHVHVALGEEEGTVGVGITSDDVVQLMASDSSSSSNPSPPRSRAPIDQTRWSEYSASGRSRSSSVGQGNLNVIQDGNLPRLQQKPSYDMGWHPVDERDEVGMSEEETDDDAVTGEDIGEEEDGEKEEERTSAVVVAEEGTGLILQGDGAPVSQLQVQPGTTHLIIGSSSTPNAMPPFLTNVLPQISFTLLALDISANFLGALPPSLAACIHLEELNIASNPLRVLPAFLCELVSLRVLIADSTGISTLPDPLSELSKLHTLSMRRNKLHALPSWLCLLNSLQTLYVDGNPFQGPWKALVEPLLAKIPMSPAYPPSTPVFPLPSASIPSSSPTRTDPEDIDEYSDSPQSGVLGSFQMSPEEEEQTITPDRAPPINRAVTSPFPGSSAGLTRTRTTPNRAFHNNKARAKTIVETKPPAFQQPVTPSENAGLLGNNREVRKMKSAGDLRRAQGIMPPDSPAISPPRPNLPGYGSSASSSNLLNINPTTPERPRLGNRFASLGPSSGQSTPMRRKPQRPSTSGGPRAVWDTPSETEDEVGDIHSNRTSFAARVSPSHKPFQDSRNGPIDQRSDLPRDPKEKSSRWGFLKKMSMGKMRIDSPPSLRSQTSSGHSPRPQIRTTRDGVDRFSKTPQIDMRFSTLGSFDPLPPTNPGSPVSNPTVSVSPPQLGKKPSKPTLLVPSSTPPPSSGNLLGIPTSTPRAQKRRSFLPLDTPVSIPDASHFLPGVTVSNGDDVDEPGKTAPNPTVEPEQVTEREEERAREAYVRALRSVMAYLKDMNDLGLSQAPNPQSIYGGPEDPSQPRSRRPTIVEREPSVAMSSYGGQLRSMESISALRSGTSSQTVSVATTDSAGSSEERKFKDDKGKRAMVVREIVETERTYVKGLQELVDIYIKPGSAPVNLITGVSKETVVPPPERKVVFGAVDSLFSFHKESFLPALEVAVKPIMKSSAALQESDPDGQLSLKVARDVGNVFLKHAAFLKMYQSYINNFDTSVNRVKYWTSDRINGSASPGTTLSPSSSTAQLVGLGLAMSALAPAVTSDGGPSATGVPNLTSSQKRRIRSYLKRCRMNPRHSQLNLEGYLLLPVQRIPRYRLLLEELLRSTPPTFDFVEDPLDRALAEILSLANNMNEGKRESESRRKLVHWQTRIRGKFPSPLVQPHRRLIMDGPLRLTRVVRKAVVSFEAFNAQGDTSTVQVDCLAPELTPRPLVGILCNDLLVLCRDPSEGHEPASFVDLWAVLRMQTLPQPASIVHGNALRLVDNKAILYFDAPSPSDALNWFRAINLHIPASKS